MTILIIRTKFSAYQDDWELIVEKAEAFLKQKGKLGMLSSKQILELPVKYQNLFN